MVKPVKPKPRKLCRVPSSWEPKPAHHELARKHGRVLADEVAAFRDYEWPTGKGKSDFDAAFRNWLRPKKFEGGSRKTPAVQRTVWNNPQKPVHPCDTDDDIPF